MTNDVDLSLAEFVEPEAPEDIDKILKRADRTFAPKWKTGDQVSTAFQSSNDFMVDLLTRYGRGRKSPVQVPSLKCAAEALSFQEYLSEETIEAAALYGMGVLVRVPAPQTYATHKLIVAQQRNASQRAKKRKDLQQAKELIDIFLETDEVAIQDCLDAARAAVLGRAPSIGRCKKLAVMRDRVGCLCLLASLGRIDTVFPRCVALPSKRIVTIVMKDILDAKFSELKAAIYWGMFVQAIVIVGFIVLLVELAH